MIGDIVTKVIDVAGAAINVELGFIPSVIIAYNGAVRVEWMPEMGEGTGKKLKAGTMTSDAGVKTLKSDALGQGVAITDTDLIATGKLYIVAIH